MNHTTDNSSYLIRAWRTELIIGIYLAIIALLIFDKFTQPVRAPFIWGVIGLLAFLDLPRRERLTDPAFFARLILAAALLGASLLGAEAFRFLATRPGVTQHDAWKQLRHFYGWALWLGAIWLYLPILMKARPGIGNWIARTIWPEKLSSPDRDDGVPGKFLFWHATILMLFTFGCFAASLASLKPNRSFLAYSTEIGLYAPLYLFWIRNASAAPGLQIHIKRLALVVFFAASTLGFFVGLTYRFAPPALQTRMEQTGIQYSKLIRKDLDENKRFVWHLNFPFGHHNRMAYYSMLACMCFAAAGFLAKKRGIKPVLAAAAVMAFYGLVFTSNRGALLALVAGSGGVLILFLRRGVWLLALIPLVYFVMPQAQRQRVQTILSYKTYADPNSSVVHRFKHWQAAGIMIRDFPVHGIGYGWSHFQQYYAEMLKERIDSDEVTHAHNAWLEVTAECGIPVAIAWLLFNASRWALLLKAWRGRRLLTRDAFWLLAFWVGVEIAIQAFCLQNYPLRRSLGLLTWGFWGVMMADLLGPGLFPARATQVPPAPALETVQHGERDR